MPQAGGGLTALCRLVAAVSVKALENSLLRIGGQTRPLIGNQQKRLAVALLCGQEDAPSRRRERNRIGQKIVDDLGNARLLSQYRTGHIGARYQNDLPLALKALRQSAG